MSMKLRKLHKHYSLKMNKLRLKNADDVEELKNDFDRLTVLLMKRDFEIVRLQKIIIE